MGLANFFTSPWARGAVQWTYRILPKNSELHSLANRYWLNSIGSMPAYYQRMPANADYWWPVWTSAAFMLAMLAMSQVVLSRKDL